MTITNDFKKECKLCGKSYEVIYRDLHDTRYGSEGLFSIGYCNDCALGETFPKPSPDDLPSLYEEFIGDSRAALFKRFYRKYKRSQSGIRLIFKLDRANKFLAMLPPSPQARKLLDIGCGCGDWLTFFKMQGYDVKGVDLNPRVVEIARSRGLNVKCQSIEEMAAEGETFDIVILSQVLEHLTDPSSVLRKIHDILKPGGRFLVAVPNLESRWQYFFKTAWINWYLPFHLFHFTSRSLTKTLENAGFEVKKMNSYTPPSWFMSSVMVRYFDKYGKANRFLNKWWHHILWPFIGLFLSIAEKMKKNKEGDCLCALSGKANK